MGKRRSVYKIRDEYAESRPSPNAVVPKITVEVRAFYPPGMGHEERVAQLIRQVMHEAIVEVYPAAGPHRVHVPRSAITGRFKVGDDEEV